MSSLKYESQVRPPLVVGDKTYHQISEDIIRPIENRPSKLWWTGFLISVLLLCFGIFSVTREVIYGMGQWNLNKTIGWAWDITNFVWWIGIGHAGTLISAILLLFRQQWRTGVNRAAEAMTIFAVMCAGQFPIWHMGRVWVAFFCLPYPNTRGALWPNFNSPLLWDVFAISTYFTVSLLFWYCGLLPDLATVRDRAKLKWRKFFYGVASFGWSGSTKHWQRHEALSLVLAGLSYTAGTFGSYHCILRLRHFGCSRLAYNHLPALFCSGCGILRFRDGAIFIDYNAKSLEAGRLYHDRAYRCDE